MNVSDEIRLYASDEDKFVLSWLFGRYHWASQWSFVARCELARYGVESYKTRRIWKPTIEGLAIYKQLS